MNKKIIFGLIIVFILSSLGAIIAFIATDGVDFNESIKVNDEKIFSIDNVNQIDISASSADVNIILVESNEIKVKYYGEIRCFICNAKNELNGSKEDDKIEFTSKFNTFGIHFYNNIKMDVYLPKTYEKDLTIYAISSDILVEKLTLDYLHIKSVSGDISASELTLKDAKFSSTSGDIDLSDVSVENITQINITSGDLTMESVNSDVKFNLESGDVEAHNFQGDFIGLSTSGNIDIDEIASEFIVDINCISGNVKIDVNNDALFNFVTDTTSGNIAVNFEYTVAGSSNDKHNVDGRIGESTNNIKIKTLSGNIIIK